MSRIGDIKTALQQTLESVAEVGVIMPWEVVQNEQHGGDQYIREQFSFNGKIRGLHFWRESHDKERTEFANDAQPHVSVYSWSLEYYLQREGNGQATQALIDDKIEAMQDAVLANWNLGGAVTDVIVEGVAGIQVLAAAVVNFYGISCHFAQLGLTVYHHEEVL